MIAIAVANSTKYRNAYHSMFISAISNGAYEEDASRRDKSPIVATCWDSTYNMLEVALEFRHVL